MDSMMTVCPDTAYVNRRAMIYGERRIFKSGSFGEFGRFGFNSYSPFPEPRTVRLLDRERGPKVGNGREIILAKRVSQKWLRGPGIVLWLAPYPMILRKGARFGPLL